ncbi:hypothetical protein D3C76_1408500 [compost metagenome]
MQEPHFGRGDATGQRHAGIPAGPFLWLDVLLGQPVANRELVQFSSSGRFPGCAGGHVTRHLAQLTSHAQVGAEGALEIELQLALPAHDDRAPLVIGREGADLQLASKVFDSGLARAYPLASHFRDMAIHLVVEGTPAHPVPCFQD